MDSTNYDHNMDLIKTIDPDFYEKIIDYRPNSANVQVKIEEARNESKIVAFLKDGRKWRLNSLYNPNVEADRFVQQYKNRVIDHSVMMILGFGNGIMPLKMVKELPDNVRYIFYEPSIDIFIQVIHYFDLRELLSCDRVRVIVKGYNDNVFEGELGSMIQSDNYRLIFFDTLPKYKEIFKDEYEFVRKQYTYLVKIVKTNIVTRQYFGQMVARNDLYNMRYFVGNSNFEEDFEDVFPKNEVAIVVAAGPSLEKNIQELKKAKGKVLIIAVDTALRYMMEQGIMPDLAVAADPEKPTVLFEDERIQHIPLAINSAVNYECVELMKDKIIYATSPSAYYNKVLKSVNKTMYKLRTGGSVATVAFSLLIAWGYRKIVLVGQDLAFSDKIHAGKDDVDVEKHDADMIEVDGYYGEKVYTTWDYEDYLRWYETIIRLDDNLEVINATEGGACIHGTIQMPLSQVVEQYCIHEFDYEGTIRRMKPSISEVDRKVIIGCWRESIHNMDMLRKTMADILPKIHKEILKLKKGIYKATEVKKLHESIVDFVKFCDEIDEIYFIDRMSATETEDILADLYEVRLDGAEEHCRILEKLEIYISGMSKSVEEIQGIFNKVIQDVTSRYHE